MAFGILLGMEFQQYYYDVMFGLSAIIMIFMFLDFLIFWGSTEYIYIEEINIQQENTKSVHKEKAMELFDNYLYHGTLGNIEKGEQKDE